MYFIIYNCRIFLIVASLQLHVPLPYHFYLSATFTPYLKHV